MTTHPTQATTPPTQVRRATFGFAISLVAGILSFLFGKATMDWAINGEASGFPASLPLQIPIYLPRVWIAGANISTLSALEAICAIIVTIGAILIYMPGKETTGGTLVIMLSVIGFVLLPSIFIILGIIGGALGLAKK